MVRSASGHAFAPDFCTKIPQRYQGPQIGAARRGTWRTGQRLDRHRRAALIAKPILLLQSEMLLPRVCCLTVAELLRWTPVNVKYLLPPSGASGPPLSGSRKNS